jgi:hypothetical protein
MSILYTMLEQQKSADPPSTGAGCMGEMGAKREQKMAGKMSHRRHSSHTITLKKKRNKMHAFTEIFYQDFEVCFGIIR